MGYKPVIWRPASGQRGLTLIELLVAISVLAFVAVLGWRGLDGIVRARVALTDNLEHTRGMQLAFAQLQNDCAHIATKEAIANRAPLAADSAQGRLMMVRTVFSDGQPTRVQVITYRVKDGMLTRRESVATRDLGELNALWLAAANDTDNSQAIVLQQGVSAMTMRLWSNSGKQWQEPDASAVQNAGSASTTQAQQSQQNQQTQTTSSGSAAAAAAAQQAAAAQTAFTGLELALQMQGTQDKMLKVFLLGAV